jgi:hypothetical protein
MFNLLLAAIKSVADLLKGWFGKQAKEQKDKEDAAKKTSERIFYSLCLPILFFSFIGGGCRTVYVVSTPMTFDPADYQPLKKGQEFTVPADGIYFSNYAAQKWIKAKIAEYEIRKRGFDKGEDK